MIALIQRVSAASVAVTGENIAVIGPGLLVFVGVQPPDTESDGARLVERILKYRIFGDESGKMNVSLQQLDGELLLVPQFTLAADTRQGLRPGLSTAAPPEQGRRLFYAFRDAARARHPRVHCGEFGAHMQVSLINDGPVTFWLES